MSAGPLPFDALPGTATLRRAFQQRAIALADGGAVLDAGCGDGADAAAYVSAGLRAVACDPIARNVAIARARGIDAFEDAWPGLRTAAAHGPFDLIASNFGALNAAVCADGATPWRQQLTAILARTAELLTRHGRFIVSVIAPAPPVDLLQALLRLDLRFIARRASPRPLVRALDGHEGAPAASVPITAAQLARSARPWFRVTGVWGCGLGVSPAIAARYARVPLAGALLARMAASARGGWIAAGIGDHAVVELVRTIPARSAGH